MSKFVENLVMPVCQKAITKTVKEAHHNPAKKSQSDGDQMEIPCFRVNPTQQIKKSEECVKKSKEPIEKNQHMLIIAEKKGELETPLDQYQKAEQ